MAKFTAYFDASGQAGVSGGTMFVSGFVAPVGKWLQFEAEWLALLAEYGIQNPFHMTEFVACRGQFTGWAEDERRSNEFYGRVLKAIKRRISKAFSQGVILDDFTRVQRDYIVPEAYASASLLKSPLAYCGVGVLIQLAKWASRLRRRGGTKVDGEVEIVFDRGDKHRGLLANAVRDVFGIDLIFENKKNAVPIQAADILAWEHARVVGAIKDRRLERLRQSAFPDIQRLFPGSGEWVYLNAKKLAAFLDEDGVQRREDR